MALKNEVFLKALRKEKTPYTPIWLMRQAGRYLSEYRDSRKRAGSFMNLAMTPELACEVTLQPVRKFNLDAAILFSDILTVPDAMGLGLSFVPEQGPKFIHAVQSEETVRRLENSFDMNRLNYVFEAVKEIKKALNDEVPLIGFTGSPFTLACYMVEGGSSKSFETIKRMVYERPDLLHRILSINSEAVVQYLLKQIENGVDAVMIFDTWGGILGHQEYLDFSLSYSKLILDNLSERGYSNIPSILFTKGGAPWVNQLADSGVNAIGVDWTTSLKDVRLLTDDKVALQGNLDPVVLFSSEKVIRQKAREVIEDYGVIEKGGHVFNLGHGIDKDTPEESVSILVDEVHTFSRNFHIA